MTTRTSSIEIAIAPSPAATLRLGSVFCVAYLLCGLIGLELAIIDGRISPMWPASGLAIGVLVRWGMRWWPCVLIGATLINLTTGMPPTALAAIGIGNTLEAVAAVTLLRAAAVDKRLPRPRDVLWFAMLAGCSATLVAAGIGVTALSLAGEVGWAEYPTALLTWWVGDAMGALLLAPVILLLPLRRRRLPAARPLELAGAATGVIAIALLAFAMDPAEGELSPLSFLLWPLLLWPALRLGPFATAAASALVALIAIATVGPSLDALGDFAQLNRRLAFLQGFLATSSIAALVLATAVVQYRQAAASLRLTQHAVEAAGDAVLWVGEDGRVAYANPAMARLMQRPVELLMGADFLDCVAGIDEREWVQLLDRLGERERIVRQLDLLPYTGGRVPIELAASRLVYDDRTYACLILRDLSERKRLEDHLTQAQKMDAIGRLAGGIAHDFNNMLAAMYGNAELLQMQLEAKGEDLRHVTNIVLTCERAKELTNQLMVFSRKDNEDTQVIDLSRAVQEAVDLNRRVISESIAIEHRPAEGSLLVQADPSRIQQLVMNLMLNARDAMPGGGRIVIESESVEVTQEDCGQMPQAHPGSFHRLRISDTGAGISEEALSRIFEPFFTTKESGRGTGLGLAIVHGIVKRAGGFITVASSRGSGTRFDIYLPAAQGPREQTTSGRLATTAIARIGRGKRALVVEDDASVREMVKSLLEKASFAVDVATNGKDGLRRVDENPGGFDLIVTDLVMPDLGGVDMASGIRERSGTLPVLFMSGYGEEEAGESQAPNTAFLGKPFTVQDFALTVRRLLNPKPKL